MSIIVIAVPTFGSNGLSSFVSSRFGRAESFTFVTVNQEKIIEIKTVSNSAGKMTGGAGTQASKIVAENKASVAIVGFLGPNASQSLQAFNIKVFQAPDRKIDVKEVIDLYLNNKLEEIKSPNVDSHSGMNY